MLYRCGLLQKGSVNLVPYVSRIYHRDYPDNIASGFKRTYCQECRPHLIGVWDTVGSLGWFLGRTFFDAALNRDVKYGYHAVSIDERRKKFAVSLWDETNRDEQQRIEQVWFAGVHSDVGGSYPEHGLSDIALKWMLENARAQGLRLKADRLAALDPCPSGCLHNSRTGGWRLCRPVSRQIPNGALVHRSVEVRRDDERLGYKPSNLPHQDDYTSVD